MADILRCRGRIVNLSAGAGVRYADDCGAGGCAESALEARGYTWIRTDKEGGDAYSY